MKILTILFAASIVFFGMACGNDKPSTESTGTVDPNAQFAPVTSETAPLSGDVKLNPPHGEPGHRCEIAVGAPLDGSPAPAPATTTETSPIMQTTPQSGAPSGINVAPAAGTTATAPGMNPPHGQPGHRCDIAVGAPLPK